jgi:lysophospholipase L1-like esterase
MTNATRFSVWIKKYSIAIRAVHQFLKFCVLPFVNLVLNTHATDIFIDYFTFFAPISKDIIEVYFINILAIFALPMISILQPLILFFTLFL